MARYTNKHFYVNTVDRLDNLAAEEPNPRRATPYWARDSRRLHRSKDPRRQRYGNSVRYRGHGNA